MKTQQSEHLFERAQKLIPGGVNSPVRAFRSVGSSPRFISRARGATMWDADGNAYLDYVGSWGPLILGHANQAVIDAVVEAALNGTSFGAATEREVEMAEMISQLMPSIEMVRMVNSGTEATMSAIRLARAFTQREKIIKFEGCYHGHADAFLVKAGSGAMTLGIPDSPGVPKATADDTLTARYNSIESVHRLVGQNRNSIAAIIVEPVVGNMGCVPPAAGFLHQLREICTSEKIVLIFDEVMTGFRLSRGGAQELFGIQPDLTTLGKVIGGGLPVGAYGGKREIMQLIAPSGPVYQAGTLSGNPLAMAAGLATLRILAASPRLYRELDEQSDLLATGVQELIGRLRLPLTLNRVGSMFTLFFADRPVTDYESAKRSDTGKFYAYFQEMLSRGIYLPPSQFEAAFLSTVHTKADIAQTVAAAEDSLRAVFNA